jgi:hypothetical protein
MIEKNVNIIAECESIISCVENVYDMIDNADILDSEDFIEIRYIAETIQQCIIDNDNIEELSIELYQNAKYTIEALEESITDTEILSEFGYIRASVSIIRTLIVE